MACNYIVLYNTQEYSWQCDCPDAIEPVREQFALESSVS